MTDTIAAIATPSARSAIGILRLSGPKAVAAAAAVFQPQSGRGLEQASPHQLVYGRLFDRTGRPIDQALATVSRAPHSYTGEDTAEIHCHGSPTVLALGLEALFAQGVRQAKAGEFTQQAFLNGKLDLTQAEAVADLIDAETPAAVRVAAGQLSGSLGRRVEEIYGELTDLVAHFCAVLDYPEEDIDPFQAKTIQRALETAQGKLRALLATYQQGRRMTRGIRCAIMGRPNAGKSSLLNALVGYERAIVTHMPGTTRDTIEETVQLGGRLLRLVDTAGLRATEDEAERLGVARSRAAMAGAELILVLADGSLPFSVEDEALLRESMALAPTLFVSTKRDLPTLPMPMLPLLPTVSISAKTGAGLEELSAAISALFPPDCSVEEEGELLTNLRQAEAAGRALGSVEQALAGQTAGVTPDAVLSDVESALGALGELTGRTVREDVTQRIFQRFCVGK